MNEKVLFKFSSESLKVAAGAKCPLYPSSTNLHSLHHRPLFKGEVLATAEIINKVQ